MIDGKEYISTVKKSFAFLEQEFNFKLLAEKIRGNAFYDVQFTNGKQVISISYENIEDYFLVTIFILHNGQLPDYDDKTKTLHLHKLNSILLSLINKDQLDLNNNYFSSFKTNNLIEKKILKSAKELRLCLQYFDKLYSAS